MSEAKIRYGKSRAMVAGFLASVLGLAVGVGTGVPEGKALGHRLFTMRVAAVSNELATFSAVQFEHAGSANARRAVQAEIETLEDLAPLAAQLPTHASERIAALYLAFARLSLIEQRAGDAAAAQQAQQRAREYWSRLHPGAQWSPEQMAQSVREFDQSGKPKLIQ